MVSEQSVNSVVSKPEKRRRNSDLTRVNIIAVAVICGLGIDGYSAAVEFVCVREGKN